MANRVTIALLLAILGLLAWGKFGSSRLEAQRSRFNVSNQGSGVFTIHDPVSGGCWLMVDRGDAGAVTTAPEAACR
jgi:hypothetical protein